MVERKQVGVTGNARRYSPGWYCSRLALALVGARSIRISIQHSADEKKLDALIIGGGDDISPEHYGQDIQEKVKPDPARDELEISWIKKALHSNIPMLGICRGAQLINVVLGGTLYQDIRPIRFQTYNRPGLLPTKQVLLEDESRIATICGKSKLRVNSLHNQAINEQGAGLRVVGRDLDGIVQAVEHVEGRSIVGVQWHPEYLWYLPSQLALFRWLVKEIR